MRLGKELVDKKTLSERVVFILDFLSIKGVMQNHSKLKLQLNNIKKCYVLSLYRYNCICVRNVMMKLKLETIFVFSFKILFILKNNTNQFIFVEMQHIMSIHETLIRNNRPNV